MEKQLTQEEINTIKNLQNQIQQLALQLGTIEIKKFQLKNEIEKLQQQEEQVAKSLSDKYGNGTLDIDTGKLTIVD